MSFTQTQAITNSFRVKDTNLVKKVMEQLSFDMYVNEENKSLQGYADEDIIDDTIYVALTNEDGVKFADDPKDDTEDVRVFSELLGNYEEVDFTPNAVPFETFIQDQLLEGECLIITSTGTTSRMAGVIDTWGGVTVITKDKVFATTLDNEVEKFLTQVAYDK